MAKNQGFDPLSSLFDPPSLPPRAVPRARITQAPEEETLLAAVEQEAAEAEAEPVPANLAMSAEEPRRAVAGGAVDKAALARTLARAAMARAGAPTVVPKSEPPKPVAVAEAPAPQAKKGKKARGSLATRAARPMSAQEAMKRARQDAEAAEAARIAAREAALPARIADILERQLPGVRNLRVLNALRMDERQVLTALWKAHRARLAAEGAVDAVVAVTTVIRALGAVAPDQLVAAIVDTDTSNYLVWIDLGSEATIAAFPDARSWYARLKK